MRLTTLDGKDMRFKKDLSDLFNMGFTDFDLNLKHLHSQKSIDQVIELILKDTDADKQM